MEHKSRGHNKKCRIKRRFKAFNNDWRWMQAERHKEAIAAERTQEEIKISLGIKDGNSFKSNCGKSLWPWWEMQGLYLSFVCFLIFFFLSHFYDVQMTRFLFKDNSNSCSTQMSVSSTRLYPSTALQTWLTWLHRRPAARTLNWKGCLILCGCVFCMTDLVSAWSHTK